MKYVAAIGALLLVLMPGLALAADIITVFPGGRILVVLPPARVNGVDHIVFTISPNSFTAQGVALNAGGTPAFETLATPWIQGDFVSVQQNGSSFNITWNISLSAGGLTPTFIPVGPITVTLTP
jgi:hypothetical protein